MCFTQQNTNYKRQTLQKVLLKCNYTVQYGFIIYIIQVYFALSNNYHLLSKLKMIYIFYHSIHPTTTTGYKGQRSKFNCTCICNQWYIFEFPTKLHKLKYILLKIEPLTKVQIYSVRIVKSSNILPDGGHSRQISYIRETFSSQQ